MSVSPSWRTTRTQTVPSALACLGRKWIEAAALVPILAMAMPMMTLQILFAPASNALGRPGIAVRTGLVGAALCLSPSSPASNGGWRGSPGPGSAA